MAASTACTRHAVGSSAWQRAQITDVHGVRELHVPWMTEGSPSWTWQAGGGSFLLLPRRHALSSRRLWTFKNNTCENRLEEFQGAASSLFPPSLFQYVAACTALVCGAQCPIVCTEMTGQWSDRSAMSSRKTSPPDPMSYLRGLALKIWNSFWRREGSAGVDMWNVATVQSRQPLTFRLKESVGLGGQRWHGSSWQRGIAESGSSRLLTLMIDIPGDLVWDLPCVQQASWGRPTGDQKVAGSTPTRSAATFFRGD